MPEGPEVKTVARTLAEQIVGKELGSLWHSDLQLRQSADYLALKRCENMVVDDVSSYGKVLFVSANMKPAWFAQLGMTGQLKVEPIDAPVVPHTHVRWKLNGTNTEIRYIDPRRFGQIDVCSEQKKLAIIGKLGPDPFTMTSNDHAPLIAKMKRSNRSIKEVLLDQSVVAGVGNIYASEALFVAGISPEKPASQISTKNYQKLIPAIIDVLALAYKNCGTTFSNYVDGTGKKGENLGFLKVFQRNGESCYQCATPIERIKQGGRSTFFCAKCQR